MYVAYEYFHRPAEDLGIVNGDQYSIDAVTDDVRWAIRAVGRNYR